MFKQWKPGYLRRGASRGNVPRVNSIPAAVTLHLSSRQLLIGDLTIGSAVLAIIAPLARVLSARRLNAFDVDACHVRFSDDEINF